MEIIWSPRSLEKLEQIGNYIAKDAPERSISFMDRLVASVERLKDFPLSGQVTREHPAFRQVVLQGYRIIYRVTQEFVEIITIISPKENT